MGIAKLSKMWPFTKKKEKDARANYEFTKADRDFSAELRQKNQELKFKEQQLEHQIRMKELEMQLGDLDYELNGEEETNQNPDMMLMTLFSQILNKQPAPVAPIAPISNAPEQVSLSDDELRNMWESVPKQYKLAVKVMSDEKVLALIKQQVPNANEDTYVRAISIIREKK